MDPPFLAPSQPPASNVAYLLCRALNLPASNCLRVPRYVPWRASVCVQKRQRGAEEKEECSPGTLEMNFVKVAKWLVSCGNPCNLSPEPPAFIFPPLITKLQGRTSHRRRRNDVRSTTSRSVSLGHHRPSSTTLTSVMLPSSVTLGVLRANHLLSLLAFYAWRGGFSERVPDRTPVCCATESGFLGVTEQHNNSMDQY
jgi:hypothetical protein